MDTQHIIVIGAGLVGLCTADALAARGARVTLIDARPGPCEGTSFSNSGMIHPSQAQSWTPKTTLTQADQDAARVTVELAKRSKTLLLDKIKQYKLPERASGCLQILPDIEAARAMQASQKALGIRTDIVIDPIQSFGLPACRFPDDRSGDSRVFGCALADDLAARDVQFIYGAETVDLRRADAGFSVRAAGRVLSCDNLVVAAGVGSEAILAKLGVRLRLDLISGAAADFALPDTREGFPTCPVMDTQSRSALTIFADRVRVSGGWDVTDPTTIVKRWADIAPDFFNRLGVLLSVWTAQRPVSPVGRPYISQTSVPGLWVNTGHGHMGWTLCAGSGELLAEMMLEGRLDQRFAFAG